MSTPTTQSVLGLLSKQRIVDLGRDVGIAVPPAATKDDQVDLLARSGLVTFQWLMRVLGRDELKALCRAHALEESGRARQALAQRLLEAHGAADSMPPPSLFRANEIPRYAPRPGDIVQVRHRQWLVEDVVAPPAFGHATRVRVVCLDDDNQGRVLEVLWELELGARVMQPETHGLGQVTKIDPPRYFGAYFHALKWSSVTATDAKLFQAPFRAGIKLMDHQLTPLKKALSLPRANLFIADDVGLGKTIEAGLVMQELLLRQRVEFILVIAPASVCLQWRDEMEKRFGLRFEVMSRHFIARRRQERGFGVNPWSTHSRFIVSHQIMRRPEYRDPLLQHIGERAKKSLLVLDEAHVAAPASATKYAVDSRITRVIRDIAPRFENRLFLSATPHNGHSNSFSALLEILDPQRFTRGVRVEGAAELESVMVRRLKEDLRQLGVEHFPRRKLIQIALTHANDGWQSHELAWNPKTGKHERSEPRALESEQPVELELSAKLAEYSALMKPEKGRGKLVFINLQKRLLSSIEAFCRTLEVHARSMAARGEPAQFELASAVRAEELEDDEYGPDDETLEAAESADVARATRQLDAPAGTARRLLDEMLTLAQQYRGAADAKVLAVVDWIRRHQCPGVRIGGSSRRLDASARRWTDQRVLIFTEYGDTKRYLFQLLTTAVEGTERAGERILQFHGGMSDEQREEVQRAFNGPPDEHAVRILIATDAAREGVNLQGHCADLFHFDVPWNPARMEQRNGRIDRTLQPADEVRCHYFIYPARGEDLVLEKLVDKVDTIQRELGSLSTVLLDRMAEVLEEGIDAKTAARLATAEDVRGLRETVGAELEASRRQLDKLRAEIEESGEILNRSKAIMEFDRALLRDAIDVGLELADAGKLEERTPVDGAKSWTLPELPESWQATLDVLRPPRGRDEAFWEWRKHPPQPVLFEPPPRMNSALVQLHLQHPFVQRILGRFLAQGYSAHDLSRVTVVRNRHDALVRIIAFGRLSLFGTGAARLHDQLISVAARWVEGSAQPLRPFAEDADKKAIDLLEQILAESPTLEGIAEGVQQRVVQAAPALFNDLWPFIHEEADARAHDAIKKLETRGRTEADALRQILAAQKESIDRELDRRAQLPLDFVSWDRQQREQYERDKQHMAERRARIDREAQTEPAQIEALYKVMRHRLEPIGLVCLWPTTRG